MNAVEATEALSRLINKWTTDYLVAAASGESNAQGVKIEIAKVFGETEYAQLVWEEVQEMAKIAATLTTNK